MNFYEILIREQDNKIFQETCIKFTILTQDEEHYFYIPYFIWKLVDVDCNYNKNFQISLSENESLEGFKEFVKDILQKNSVNKFENIIDLDKQIFSLRYNDNFYNLPKDGIDVHNYIDLMNRRNDKKYFNQILLKYLLLTSKKDLYGLKTKYGDIIPDEFLNNFRILLSIDTVYDLNILKSFKNICYRKDTFSKNIIEYKLNKTDDIWQITMYNPKSKTNTIIEYDGIGDFTIGHKGKMIINGVYRQIFEKQLCDKFIQKSTMVNIIINNNINKLYIPNKILKDLDLEYYNSIKSGLYKGNDFDIFLENIESFDNFNEFFKDYLRFDNEHKLNIDINEKKDIYKYIIAERFNKDYIYKSVNKYWENNVPDLELLFDLTGDTIIFDKLLLKVFKKEFNHSNFSNYKNQFYNLKLKYNQFPDQLLEEISIKYNEDYDLEVLSKFKKINMYSDNYSTVIIEKINEFAWKIKIDGVEKIYNGKQICITPNTQKYNISIM